jgi:hypothetical protein
LPKQNISTGSRNSTDTESDTFKNSLDIAQHVEKWGYDRFWLAEHHNMPGIASSATSILIGYIASGTTTLSRVGRNYVTSCTANSSGQFGTLATLFLTELI